MLESHAHRISLHECLYHAAEEMGVLPVNVLSLTTARRLGQLIDGVSNGRHVKWANDFGDDVFTGILRAFVHRTPDGWPGAFIDDTDDIRDSYVWITGTNFGASEHVMSVSQILEMVNQQVFVIDK